MKSKKTDLVSGRAWVQPRPSPLLVYVYHTMKNEMPVTLRVVIKFLIHEDVKSSKTFARLSRSLETLHCPTIDCTRGPKYLRLVTERLINFFLFPTIIWGTLKCCNTNVTFLTSLEYLTNFSHDKHWLQSYLLITRADRFRKQVTLLQHLILNPQMYTLRGPNDATDYKASKKSRSACEIGW